MKIIKNLFRKKTSNDGFDEESKIDICKDCDFKDIAVVEIFLELLQMSEDFELVRK